MRPWMFLGIVAACGYSESSEPADAGPSAVDVDMLIGVVPLDLLFVVDNSGNMQRLQPRLATAIAALDQRLGAGPARPTLHAGVTSTDLGLPASTSDPNCNDNEPGGLTTNQCAAIAVLDPPYLTEDLDAITGERSASYVGSFSNALGCMVQLGLTGCGYEQTLEAMKRALAAPGFVRDDADLVVVLFSNEDDCSIASPEFPAGDGFDCFTEGVVCSPDEPEVVGTKAGCTSREDSTTVHPVGGYVDFLRDLKLDRTRLTVGVIGETTTEAVVEEYTPAGSVESRLEVQVRCELDVTEGSIFGYPANRLAALAAALEEDSITSSICAADFDDVLDAIGRRAYRDSDGTCTDARAAGSCDLTLSTPGSARLDVPACDAAGDPPCWQLVDDTACAESHQRLQIVTEQRPVQGTRLQGRCSLR